MSDEIIHRLDKISEDIGDIKIQSAVQNQQLKEHMHRTELLEKRTELIEERVSPIENKILQASVIIKVLLGLVTFFSGLPHAERLLKYLLTLLH